MSSASGILAASSGPARSQPRPTRRERFDLAGFLLVGLGLVCLVASSAAAQSAGWRDLRALALLAGGAAALVPIVAWEVPLAGLHLRAFLASQVADLCLFVSVSGMLFLLAQYFRVVDQAGPVEVGVRLLPWCAAVAVALPFAAAADNGECVVRNARSHRGARTTLIVGLSLHAAGLLCAAVALDRGSGQWLAAPLLLSGIGVAMALPTARRATVTMAGFRQPSGTVGGYGAVRLAGGGLGVALLAAVFARHGSDVSPRSFLQGAVPALAAAASVAAVGAVAALALPARGRPEVTRAVPQAARGVCRQSGRS